MRWFRVNPLLEVQAELEFNQATARIVRARHSDVAVGGARLAEAGRGGADASDSRVGVAEEEVCAVEGVQERDAAFEVHALRDGYALRDV